MTLSCNVFRGCERQQKHFQLAASQLACGFSVDFHINKWPRSQLRPSEIGVLCHASQGHEGHEGVELFIGRRALNKIMVHADYASAETCLPRQGRAQGQGQGQIIVAMLELTETESEEGRQRRGGGIGRGEYLKWMLQNECCKQHSST